MQECGYQPDEEIYEFVVNGFWNVGMVDVAVSVVEESLGKFGFYLGSFAYSKLNNKLLQMDKIETTYNLFKKVKDALAITNEQNYCCANG